MKSLIRNVVSLVRSGTVKTSERPAERRIDDVFSGYSTASLDLADPNRTTHLERKQVGIFYADIAGYSRLTEQDEEGTHRHLVKGMTMMKNSITKDRGRINHFAGDAILAEFEDAGSALHCAIKVQRAARRWNASIELPRRLMFRIGVNFGEVISDQGDIYGNAVNLAARLENLAHSGGICVSDTVMCQLQDNPAYKFVAIGKQYVKNISEPVQAFWIEFDEYQPFVSSFTSAVNLEAVTS